MAVASKTSRSLSLAVAFDRLLDPTAAGTASWWFDTRTFLSWRLTWPQKVAAGLSNRILKSLLSTCSSSSSWRTCGSQRQCWWTPHFQEVCLWTGSSLWHYWESDWCLGPCLWCLEVSLPSTSDLTCNSAPEGWTFQPCHTEVSPKLRLGQRCRATEQLIWVHQSRFT